MICDAVAFDVKPKAAYGSGGSGESILLLLLKRYEVYPRREETVCNNEVYVSGIASVECITAEPERAPSI